MESPTSPLRSRALDRFRALAVLSMIQGHAFTALLAADALGDPQPRWYTLIHGLTAPMFLCGAGLAFGLSRRRTLARVWRTRWEQSASVAPGLRRAAGLFALGTALQLPGGSIARAWLDADAFRIACAVGPLQLIALCLVLAELLRAACPGIAQFRAGLAVWIAAVLACAPCSWAGHWSDGLPLALGTWLDNRHGSSFPALPWLAFFAFGTLLSVTPPLFDGRRGGLRMIALGVVLLGGSYALHRLCGAPDDAEVYWHAGPLYVAFRAGACATLFGLLAWGDRPEARVRASEFGPLRILSRHSLVAYVVHLVVLYGSPFSRGLVHRVHHVSVSTAAWLTLGLFAFTLSCCACATYTRSFTRRLARARQEVAGIPHS